MLFEKLMVPCECDKQQPTTKQPTTMTMNKQPTTNHDQKGEYMLFDFKKDVPFPEPERPKFKFIDLFAGIGGFRIAMQN